MKNSLSFCIALLVCSQAVSLQAQFGAPGAGAGPQGPKFGGALTKLFGDHKAFSANVDFETPGRTESETMSVPGKLSFLEGKSRFEMDITRMKGGSVPPQAAAQMKAMGMGEMVAISHPDKKLTYLIYPGLEAYTETPLAADEGGEDNYKVETTELGKEEVDGHPCIKNKLVITDQKGKQHDAIVWNATDLKKFPVKVEFTDEGRTSKMRFSEVKLERPAGSVFEPGEKFTKYPDIQALMRGAMLKRFGGAGGFPAK